MLLQMAAKWGGACRSGGLLHCMWSTLPKASLALPPLPRCCSLFNRAPFAPPTEQFRCARVGGHEPAAYDRSCCWAAAAAGLLGDARLALCSNMRLPAASMAPPPPPPPPSISLEVFTQAFTAVQSSVVHLIGVPLG